MVDPRLVCEYCGRIFFHFEKKSMHVKFYHQNEQAKECAVCGKFFPQIEMILRHLEMHHTTEYLQNEKDISVLYKKVEVPEYRNKKKITHVSIDNQYHGDYFRGRQHQPFGRGFAGAGKGNG
mgnify:CR=1 FL=1